MAGIYFVSLGCDKNRVDAERMAASLIAAGHTVVEDLRAASCAVVNTCGFIDSAKEEAIENIFDMVRAKEAGAIRAVIVTGCLAQRFGGEVRQLIPEADAVIGLARNGDIADVVARALSGETVEEFGAPEALVNEGPRALSTPPHYAYLKIAEGCSNHCTYCAIPGIRGGYRSRGQADILDEARALAAGGVRELILIAQDTTSYGVDLGDGSSLAGLLEMLCAIEELWKIRILYAYPEKISDGLIAVMARNPKIARYLDVPMQHCDAGILRRMGRRGDGDALRALVRKLRGALPDITLRSTFIAGFPGETEQDFGSLLEFLQDVRLDRAGCFAFSPEEGTPAARLPEQLDEETKNERAERFMLVQSGIMARAQQEKIGCRMTVICDGFDEDLEMFACRGDADAPEVDACVYLPYACDLVPGELYDVEITGVEGADLIAALC